MDKVSTEGKMQKRPWAQHAAEGQGEHPEEDLLEEAVEDLLE